MCLNVIENLVRIIVQSTKDYILNNVSEAPESDAVMVLGALVYSKSGEPSPTLKDRLDYGYELYSQGKAKKILIAGKKMSCYE